MFGQKADIEKAEGHKKTLEAKLAAYDVLLGRTKFLGGDVSFYSINFSSWDSGR